MTTRSFLCVTAVGILAAFASLGQAQAPDVARVNEIAGWMTGGTYGPTPTIADRDFWALVGKSSSYRSIVASGEKVMRRTFQPLPDDLYLEYSKNGNRTRYEHM
jgi:hypothetical protein